ncbi:MAG: class I SAM-dependent methyltransferase [Planctomycetaceae bacterium]
MTELPPLPDESSLLQALRASPSLFESIARANSAEKEFHLQQRLRGEFSDELVRAALILRDLRQKAVASKKFARADQMWFTPTGLEQATAELVARHKAKRFEGPVWDFCCGIGGDSLALAERGEVHSVDLDPAMCLRTEWNAEVYGVHERVHTLVADVSLPGDRTGLLHIDPDRRPSGQQRMRRVEDCSPNLEVLRVLMSEFRGGAIKLSPASNFGGKFSNVEIELVSLHGECKEATIWFGDLAGDQPFRATALPSGETIAADPLSARADITSPRAFVFDPDPAIVRAGMLDVLAERQQLARLDDAEEYLTGDQPLCSPWWQTFRVLEILPNNDRAVRAACRHLEFGSVEIKCRHLPIEVERVRRKLNLEGRRPGVLIFARVSGKATVLVCERTIDRKIDDRKTKANGLALKT